MVSTQAQVAAALWPPDDTEWSIVGVDRHQLDIMTVRGGVNEEAHALAVADGHPAALAWQAISQIMYIGCVRPDGSAYTVYPDVMVFPRPMGRDRGSYSLAVDGPPALVVEVASPHTVEADLDLVRGKAWSYRQAGVAEYLVLDPTGLLVPGFGRGWRLERGAYRPWEPEGGGQDRPRWRSRQIAVAIGVTAAPDGRPEEGLAAVYWGGRAAAAPRGRDRPRHRRQPRRWANRGQAPSVAAADRGTLRGGAGGAGIAARRGRRIRSGRSATTGKHGTERRGAVGDCWEGLL